MKVVESLVSFCCRNAGAVVGGIVLAAILSAFYTEHNFKIDTNSENLVSRRLDWRQREAHYDKLFPQQDQLILVVIDGTTQEQALRAQQVLAARLAPQKAMFSSVRQPGGGAFFQRNGLLFLPLGQVKDTTEKLIAAQPFLSVLAADPSLRGVMEGLSTALEGVNRGQARLEQLDKPIKAFGATLDAVVKGQTPYLSWQALINGDPGRTRSFLEVKAALNFNALSPGAAAVDRIRAEARALGLVPAHGVRVRMTGPVPLADEEFASIADRADLMGIVILAAVTLTLWLAVSSFRIIFAILTTLFAGLSITMALGLAAVGVFNIISIAFVALFVGLGVDFAVQFAVRYRAERYSRAALMPALVGAGRNLGLPLALAAAATAAGFFAFLPTDYVGVAELGEIAGIGMIVAFLLAITMLPALLMLLKPGGEHEEVGFASLKGADGFVRRNRRTIILSGVLLGLAGMACIPFMRFDSNPLDLRSRKVESVSTLYDLMADPQTSPNTINVLAPSLPAADKVAARLARIPEVGQTLTLSSFIPDEQPQKMALISDASLLLDTALNPPVVKPAPGDAEVVQSMRGTAKALRAAKGDAASRADAARLAGVLDRLAGQAPESRARAQAAMIPDLETLLNELSLALQPTGIARNSMPPDLVSDWIAPDGTARVELAPKDKRGSDAALRSFANAVVQAAPTATGAPISIRKYGLAITRAFAKAGLLAFVVITLLLIAVLRRIRDVLLTIAPLPLSGLLTVLTCVAIGLDFNFANVIAMPLLFGIGVAFDIYFVNAWRDGARDLLESSLTRAVVFSALTTASGFGTLWLSSHPGTASMGELLMISLGWTLATTLVFLPALLGPAPKRG
ncbi:MAG: MMPL family transporter [Alphaproteobacteria bacterium]|nr:MMPL family transporter [Alphaproteobacteria bacterium]